MLNTETINRSGLVEYTIGLLMGSEDIKGKSLKLVNRLSQAIFPQITLFVPKPPHNFSDLVPVIRADYTAHAEVVTGPDPMVDLANKLYVSSLPYVVGLTSDVEEESLENELNELGVVSYLLVSLEIKGRAFGYFGFLETEVTRLWANDDLELLNGVGKMFSGFLHTQFLEHKLSEKEALLQKAIESSNDGYWHIDLVRNKMHFSRQWKRMLGYGDNEIEGSFEKFEELLHPNDREVVLQILDPYLKIGVGSYECEYRIRNKSGKYIWVLTTAHVNYSDNGVPLQFVATNTDITTRIDYKKKIAQSEAKYERLVGSIHEILFDLDQDGTILFLNEAWERHLLLKVDKSIGTNAVSYIHPDHRAIADRIMDTKFEGDSVVHRVFEMKFIAANGRSVWMEAHATIKFGEDQELVGVRGTLININDRKEIELAKRSSENKLARISDNITDIIVETNENGHYMFISNGVRNMLGRNPESFVGKSAMSDIHPDDREMVKRNLFDQLLNGAKRVVEQYRVKTGTDSYLWIESIVQPLISASGERTFIAATRDISARRKIQEEMQAALAKEQELNELKSRFITMTSHEFRTPLSSIKSSVELLEMYAEDLGDRFMKPFNKHFQKINLQVGRINNLLNNIDTLGKIEGMEMPFNPVRQNLTEFVQNLISEMLGSQFPDREINLDFKGEQRPVVYDPNLIDHLIFNLVKNALIYSTESTPYVTVKYMEKGFELVVKDSGLGIPENEQSRLFTSFFRAQNIVNLNIPGNGLGLVIAKKIAEFHQGTISIKSAENKGTTVKVIIPQLSID